MFTRLIFVAVFALHVIDAEGAPSCEVLQPQYHSILEVPSQTGPNWHFLVDPENPVARRIGKLRSRLKRIVGPLMPGEGESWQVLTRTSNRVRLITLKKLEAERTYLIAEVVEPTEVQQNTYFNDITKKFELVQTFEVPNRDAKPLSISASFGVLLKIRFKHGFSLHQLQQFLSQMPSPQGGQDVNYQDLSLESYPDPINIIMSARPHNRFRLATVFPRERHALPPHDNDLLDRMLTLSEGRGSPWLVLMGADDGMRLVMGKWHISAGHLHQGSIEHLEKALLHLIGPPVRTVRTPTQVQGGVPYLGDYRALALLPDGSFSFIYFVLKEVQYHVVVTSLVPATATTMKAYFVDLGHGDSVHAQLASIQELTPEKVSNMLGWGLKK